MAAGSGPTGSRAKELLLVSHCQPWRRPMPEQTKRVQVLLVEDNETDAELCIRALRKKNLANDLVWLKDGAEALDFIYSQGAHRNRDNADKPNLILLDLRMPKVDGVEVLKELKSDERTKTIPVIILTS